MRDLHNNIDVRRAISPVVVSDTTAAVSQIIDCQGFDGMEFAIATGTLADVDATFTVLVEEDTASDFATGAAVADKDLLSTEALAAFTFADDDEVNKIGYIGSKRYVRLTITPVANAGSAPIAAVAIMGFPKVAPVA